MNVAVSVPKAAQDRGKIAPAQLAHIVFRTPNQNRLVEWYKTVLECEVVLSNPLFSLLTYDNEHHRIAIAEMPDLTPVVRSAAGLEHVAFTYKSADDLFATYDRLKAEGILPFWTINHGVTLSFYYRDPDGNQLELQIDIFPDLESTNAWFYQSDFKSNPIGVKFDPEDLIRRYRSGEDASELFRRPVIAPEEVLAQLPEQS